MSRIIINMWKKDKEKEKLEIEDKELTFSNYLSVLQKRLWLTDEWMNAREKFIKARMNNSWLIRENDLFRLYNTSDELNRTKDFEILNKIYDEESWKYVFTNDDQRKIFHDYEIRTGKKCFEDEEKFRKTYMIDQRNRTFEILKKYIDKNWFLKWEEVGTFTDKLNKYFQDNNRKKDFGIHGVKLRASGMKSWLGMSDIDYFIKSLISILNWDFFAWDFWDLFPEPDWSNNNRHRWESSLFSVISDENDCKSKDWTIKFRYVIVPKEWWKFTDELQKHFPHIIFTHRDNIIEKMEANEPQLKPKEYNKEINVWDIFIDQKSINEIYRVNGDTVWYKNINTWLSVSSIKKQNIPKNRKNMIESQFKLWNWEEVEITTINEKIGYKILWKNSFSWKDRNEFIKNIINGTYEIIS